MEKQLKRKKDEISILQETIASEFNLLKNSGTIGGALTHLASLLSKLRNIPSVNQILFLTETQLDEEDQSVFENLEKAVTWFHEKIKILLLHVPWQKDSDEVACMNALLNFQELSLSAIDYIGSLLFELKHVSSVVARERENYHLFEGWAEIKESTGAIFFKWPEWMDTTLNKPSMEKQIYEWREKADSSFPYLLRFLKILALYNSFTPLTVGPGSGYVPARNLREMEQNLYQVYVGNYLSAFRSTEENKHPLSLPELIKMVSQFLFMLEKELAAPGLKGPALKKEMAAAAEKYCIDELVTHAKQLSQEELKAFRKQRYALEVFDFLLKKARESKQPFAEAISSTMIKERVGPKANRLLFETHGIIWHPIPKS